MTTPAKRSLAAAVLAAWWLGAAWLFAFFVAPSAFAVMPRDLAGTLVGRVLPPLLTCGMFYGLCIALGDTSVRRWAGLVMGIACGIDRFAIVPRAIPGQPDFDLLHKVSVALYGVAAVAALIVVIAAWRSYGTQYSR